MLCRKPMYTAHPCVKFSFDQTIDFGQIDSLYYQLLNNRLAKQLMSKLNNLKSNQLKYLRTGMVKRIRYGYTSHNCTEYKRRYKHA